MMRTGESLGQRMLAAIYSNRRKLATGSATMLALGLGYYAIAGDNGLTIYRQKQAEDKHLAAQIEKLKEENSRLQAHVERLRDDPGAIEHEAREKLHYTRPGEVIYTIPEKPSSPRPDPSGSARP